MSDRIEQLNERPPEFHEGGAPEFAVLPDEFNRNAPSDESVPKTKHKMLLYLAAAGLITIGLMLPGAATPAQTAEATAAASAPTETRTGAPAPTPTEAAIASEPDASPTEDASPEATSEPTPAVQPTEMPQVTPVPTPGVEVAYYYRASQVYYAMLTVSVPERITSVSLRLTAPGVDEPAYETELTPQEIGEQTYRLRAGDRDDGFDANAFYADHMDADLAMELTYTVSDETGEQTHTETFEPDVELWIDWRFDSEEDVGGVAEWLFGEIFPNCFTVRMFGTTDLEQQLTVGSDPETLKNGGVTVTVSIDGREIPAEGSKLHSETYRYTDDETVYCDYILVIPIPEDFPPHGTATMTLTRKLTNSGAIVSNTKVIEY